MRDRPELHHAQQLVHVQDALHALDLLDAGVGAADDAHVVIDQIVEVELALVGGFELGVRVFLLPAGAARRNLNRRGQRGLRIREEGTLGLLAGLLVGRRAVSHEERRRPAD